MVLLPLILLSATANNVVPGLNAQMPKLEVLYRDLHAHPELSKNEKSTALKMAAELRAAGLDVSEGIGGYGVVGVLKNGPGPTTLIRAELDALPVKEDTGLPYASVNNGVMHACGHDIHMTGIIGATQQLVAMRKQWSGTLVVVAQPAEEVISGAKAMVGSAAWTKIPKPDYTIAAHTAGLYPEGVVAYAAGPALANSDSVEVTMYGRGTHGSAPHLGIDPITLAAKLVLELQTLVGREIDPIEPAVVTVGSLHAGTKANIISDEAKLQITVRTYDGKVREKLLARIREVAEGIAATAGAKKPAVSYPESTPLVYNDPALAQRLAATIGRAIGADRVTTVKPMMGSEDFGLFAKAAGAPAFFFFVGAAKPPVDGSEATPINHSARYAPDVHAALQTIIPALVAAVLDLNDPAHAKQSATNLTGDHHT